MPEDAVQVATVGRPHGVHGELRFVPVSGDPSRLVGLRTTWLTPASAGAGVGPSPARYAVRSVRVHGGAALVMLAGIDDRDAAGALVHAEAWARRAELPERGPDEFEPGEVIGALLLDGDVAVGPVRGVATSGGRDFFEVEHGGRLVLVPAVKDWLVRFAPEDGRIVMRLPAGLLET